MPSYRRLLLPGLALALLSCHDASGPSGATLTISVAGLPAGSTPSISVAGPASYSKVLGGGGTLAGLKPGEYAITAASVEASGTVYTATPPSQQVTVDQSTKPIQVTVTYTHATLDLVIDGMYITQSSQRYAGTVPLVTNRDGELRVFVRANAANSAAPPVRVRFYSGATLVDSLTIAAPVTGVPTTIDESALGKSWNVPLSGSRIQPGLRLVAEVNPGGAIAEATFANNRFPASGTPLALDVRTVSTFQVSFVPVQLSAGTGSVANRATFTDFVHRLHPLNVIDASTHAVYTTAQTLTANDGNGDWEGLLGEIEALRVTEGSSRHYFGVVHTSYGGGVAGIGYVGGNSAVGWDFTSSAGEIAAHELGHNWGREHSPCGGASSPDPSYPYASGQIGVYGFDIVAQTLQPPTRADVMSYCNPVWISDYTYVGVLNYRQSHPGAASMDEAAAARQPCLLIWGRVVQGRVELEPAFELTTRPVLPQRAGPYTVSGHGADGAPLFALSFEGTTVADGRGTAHPFAFALPLDAGQRSRLAVLRATAGPEMRSRLVPATAAAGPLPPAVAVERSRDARGERLHLSWDAAAHPAAMVRNARTGEVLAIARGGEVRLPAIGDEIEVLLSHGTGSGTLRVASP